jgi:hypothetical protein
LECDLEGIWPNFYRQIDFSQNFSFCPIKGSDDSVARAKGRLVYPQLHDGDKRAYI